MPQSWQRVLIALLLIGLLAVAAALRLTNINWDQFQHVHPDERFIVWVADSMTRPADLASALDPVRSTINPFRWPPGHGDEAGKPRSYAYGHVPLYLLVVVAHAAQAVGQWLGETTLALPAILQPLHTVGRHLAEYNYLALVGRAISTLCDLGTLLLIYGLGRRAYGRIAGLLAAGAYAFAVLPIQLSHFYAVDVVLTFCVVATVALAARRAEGGGWLAWIGAGIFAGLAVGSKFSAILIAAPLVAATWYRAADGSTRRRIVSATGQLAVAGAVAALTFVVTNPFAVIELRAYASNVLAQNAMVSGLMDAPYTRQYIGTLPYWYFVQQLSQWGLGWPLGLVAWGGFVVGADPLRDAPSGPRRGRDAGLGAALLRADRRVSCQIPALHGPAAPLPADLRRGRGARCVSLDGQTLGAAGPDRVGWRRARRRRGDDWMVAGVRRASIGRSIPGFRLLAGFTATSPKAASC